MAVGTYSKLAGRLMSTVATGSRRRGRRGLIWLLLLMVPLLAVIAYGIHLNVAGDSQLLAAFAELDRIDARWRLDDVEADRVVIPPAENSATPAIAAKQKLPERWPDWDYPPQANGSQDLGVKRKLLQDGFWQLEPVRQLDAAQIAALRGELKRAAEALAEARKLADMPRGRYSISYSPDFLSTLLPHVQDARVIASLLAYDVLLRAQDNDIVGALASCRAILNVGRSIGDEPLLVSQLVRMACRAIAVSKVERVLAQGEPSDDALRTLQQLLEQEEPEPLILIALRGERGGMDRFLEAVQSGAVNLSAIGPNSNSDPGAEADPGIGEAVLRWSPGYIKSQRAEMLRHMNKTVAVAKLPPEQRRDRFLELEAEASAGSGLVRQLTPAISRVSEAGLRSQAQLRCAIAAVAAERFRRDKGHWPENNEELRKSGLLPAWPNDPFDGQPLRFRRTSDGIVIYSIGPDRADDGGKIDRQHPTAVGSDSAVQLWDVAKRRQMPKSK